MSILNNIVQTFRVVCAVTFYVLITDGSLLAGGFFPSTVLGILFRQARAIANIYVSFPKPRNKMWHCSCNNITINNSNKLLIVKHEFV